MNELGMLQTMAGYNRWMNEKLYGACAATTRPTIAAR